MLTAACVHQPTLEEKVAGMTPAQKKEFLLKECKKEAVQYRRFTTFKYKEHVKRMKEICEKMSKEMPHK
jgi:hypothetical protein